MAVWLVYQPPGAVADSLLSLLEDITGLALEFPRRTVLGDFNFHADAVVSLLAMDLVPFMAILELSQIDLVPTHQAGHPRDLTSSIGTGIDLIVIGGVPWSEHFAPKTQQSTQPPPIMVWINRLKLGRDKTEGLWVNGKADQWMELYSPLKANSAAWVRTPSKSRQLWWLRVVFLVRPLACEAQSCLFCLTAAFQICRQKKALPSNGSLSSFN